MIKISFDIIRSNNLNVNTELIFYHWEKTLNNRVDFEFLFQKEHPCKPSIITYEDNEPMRKRYIWDV